MPAKAIRMMKNYLQFSQLRKETRDTNRLDLSTIEWFYPTLLLPIGLFIKQNQYIDIVYPNDSKVLNYFNIIANNDNASVNKSYCSFQVFDFAHPLEYICQFYVIR